jgi:O-antigen/teichoic acid export membrane protein
MAESLQKSMFSGMVWTFVRQFSLQGFAFIEGIILARKLNPSDYGLIAMTTFFFAITGCFTDSGFASALVRNKDRKDIDYSTVFVTNICLTGFFAFLLCICSPLIAKFYHEPFLITIVCCNAVLLFLNSFLAIQNTRLSINLQFKTQNLMRLVTNVTIGIVTVIMALMGFGIWSLILPNFLMPFLNGFMYWRYQHWFPGFKFSWEIWKKYFRYGSNLLATHLISTIYSNIYPLVIGKKFSATQLGYYTRATHYADLPAYTLRTVLGPVAFPVLSKMQDDELRLQSAYRLLIKVSAFITFPALIGLAVLARPAIITLITEKWEPSVIFLQLLCFAYMWYPLHMINLDLLQVKGRSDLFLRLEIIKKVFGVIVLVVSIPLGLFYMCVGLVISSTFSFCINTFVTSRQLKISFLSQIKDILPSLFSALLMGFLVWSVCQLFQSMALQLVLGLLIGATSYWGIARLRKSEELSYIMLLLRENVLKKIKRSK